MDPTATLTDIRTLVTEARSLTADDDPAALASTLDDLATAVDDLDRWMATGGFPPLPWATDHTTEAVS